MPEYYALIPAAGSGRRAGGALPKQYQPLRGRPLVYHAVRALCVHPDVARVFVVLDRQDTYWPTVPMGAWADKLETLHCGGATRAESVRNGLDALASRVAADDWILVHDAARPCLTQEALDRLFHALRDDAVGGLLAVPLADTLKRANADGCVARTEPRDGLWRAQTPQMFRYALLRAALHGSGISPTDESGAMEQAGHAPRLVRGEESNIKVTYAEDFALAERLLKAAEAHS